ncbi:hypothetical protein BDR05DRAFT_956812 [Suillus weaverae]|nr:hypothetical protein BDR05DRAFT_956812 [Suillus weaverae]
MAYATPNTLTPAESSRDDLAHIMHPAFSIMSRNSVDFFEMLDLRHTITNIFQTTYYFAYPYSKRRVIPQGACYELRRSQPKRRHPSQHQGGKSRRRTQLNGGARNQMLLQLLRLQEALSILLRSQYSKVLGADFVVIQ